MTKVVGLFFYVVYFDCVRRTAVRLYDSMSINDTISQSISVERTAVRLHKVYRQNQKSNSLLHQNRT
ncbi:hypothetical protein FLCH110379_16365 [Flavobacterium chungbukense]